MLYEEDEYLLSRRGGARNVFVVFLHFKFALGMRLPANSVTRR
jgi:hypothetical protein